MSEDFTVGDLCDKIPNVGVEDVLIVLSAVVSALKSFLSIGWYSNGSIVLSVLELGMSGVALWLFLLNDDNILLDEDKKTFIIAFGVSICAEWTDVILTYGTVKLYKRANKHYSQPRITNEMKAKKKRARCWSFGSLLFGAAFAGIMPIITFWLSGWETDYFSPSDFSPENGHRLYIAWILLAVPVAVGSVCFTGAALWIKCGNPAYKDALGCVWATLCCQLLLPSMVGLAGNILLYITISQLAKSRNEVEAGSLTYLLTIGIIQSIENMCEYSRLRFWNQVNMKNEGLLSKSGHLLRGRAQQVAAEKGPVRGDEEVAEAVED
mmetsp:Transcript_1870/g.3711  ORF Transcript_1870/g.3711 Transcript_1870/m.3711 type:complete len:323 (-) Transcript_1870:2436-3404(-)